MLNNRIKQLRTLKAITQSELAKALNVTKQCVSNWENDNILPSVEMLCKIADYFSVLAHGDQDGLRAEPAQKRVARRPFFY